MQEISSPVQKLPASHQELRSTESAAPLLPTYAIRISKRYLIYVVLLSVHISPSTHHTSRCATIITSLTPNKLCISTTQNEHNANSFSYFPLAQTTWWQKRNWCDPADISGFFYSVFSTDDAGNREVASKQYVNWEHWLIGKFRDQLTTDANGFLA
jgi:hypothetical protein